MTESMSSPSSHETRPARAQQVEPQSSPLDPVKIEEFRMAAARCTAIVESSEDAIMTKSLDGIVTGWNPAAERLFGYSEAEMIGEPMTRLFPPDRLEEETFILEKMRRGERISHFKTVRIKKDGTPVPVSVTLSPIRDTDGRIIGISKIVRDIFEIKRATSDLQHATEQLERQRLALDQFAIVAETDAAGCITYVNDQFCAVSKYTREELLGQTHKVVNSGHHPSAFWKAFWLILGQGKTWRGDICNRAKDGTLYWVDTTVVPFPGPDGKPVKYLAIRTLITDRKRIEQQLAHARDEAIAANSAKSRFLANMSHEIRTPMNAVIGMGHLLERTTLSARQRDYVATILSSASSLLNIINDVLDISKVEAGKMTVEQEPFSLRQCLEEAVGLVARSAQAKQLVLGSSVHDDVPDDVIGDAGRLRQVLINLLSNAIKFTPSGEVMLSVASDPTPDSPNQIVFSIRDTGIGMTEQTVQSLFSPFHQADDSTSRKYGGTGLGLAISKTLIECMGGQIRVQSVPEKGSVFSFYLPFRRSPNASASRHVGNLLARRILLVDDHDGIRLALERQLRYVGMDVTSAASGEQAMQLMVQATAAKKPFDAIVLDRKMPLLDGLQLARLFRRDKCFSKVPVILTSGADDFPSKKILRAAGIRYCLGKPFTLTQMAETISRALLSCPSAETDEKRIRPIAAPFKLKARVLLAEDNEANQKLMGVLLKDMGLSVDTVSNGLESIRALRLFPYDLILMDCQMPEMDGYAAAREIRRKESDASHVPIIALTAHALAGDRAKCLAAGMDEYITKPVDPIVLERVLIKWLRRGARNPQPKRIRFKKQLLSEKESLDISVLNRLTGNDQARVRSLVAGYTASTATDLKALKAALRKRDAVEIYRIAHGCAGASESYGMKTIAKLFRTIEAEARKRSLKTLGPALTLAEVELRRIRLICERFRKGNRADAA